MNSKVLQDKVKEIESHEIEMRLLRQNEKNPSDEKEGSKDESNGKDKEALCSSSQSVSLKHYDQLLCDLRCPGCTMRLQPPIFLCASGHSICRLCHFSLNVCPICSKEMTDIRSFTLERLSGKFQFPCKNLRNGCNVRLPMELMKWHEEKCIFKKTSCFMGKVWHDCAWVGREDEWLNHCKENHNQKILQNNEIHELVWNFETLKNNAGPIIAYYLIQTFGEMFNLYQIHESKEACLTWTVMLADYKETKLDLYLNADLPKFSFEIEFFKKDDPRYSFLQRFPVHFEDSETLLDDGRCVKIPIKDIQRFLDDEKNLFYHVKITSCKLKKDRWDQLLDKARNKMCGSADDASFAYFDADDDENVFTDTSNGSSSTDHKHGRDSDLLKQIFSREFPEGTIDESTRLIQKPPRKSLENRSNVTTASYEQISVKNRNSVKFSN